MRYRSGAPARPLFAAVLALPAAACAADYQLNLPRPVTPVGQSILDLHNLITVVCAIIFVIVLVPMAWSMWAHRKSRGARPASFHDNVYLEATWTVIPFMILVGMAVPSTAVLIDMYDTSRSDMTVLVTGYQWRWEYRYPEHDIRFFSTLATPRAQIENRAPKDDDYVLAVDNPLVLPVGRKVRLLMTANDVIHSWWVPQLGVKADTVPGFIREIWTRIDEPGTYRGVCAELCGRDHAYMPVVVEAVMPAEFERWVAGRTRAAAPQAQAARKEWTREALMARGEQVYGQVCIACHAPEGKGVAGSFPALADSAIANGPVEAHLEAVLRGQNTGKFPAPMPGFGGQLSDVDVAAVVTFERNSFGNDAGDVVQPAAVAALR
jgi:cytochrome c oxidase subunit 2